MLNQIAVAAGKRIQFYYPKSHQEGFVWELEFEQDHSCEVTCLDWGSNSTLLVGGLAVHIYHVQLVDSHHRLVSEIKLDLPFVPNKCQYSPCAKYFAVLGKVTRVHVGTETVDDMVQEAP
jgi:WD40 repeat protein